MDHTRSEAIANYGAVPESNKTSDAATDIASDVDGIRRPDRQRRFGREHRFRAATRCLDILRAQSLPVKLPSLRPIPDKAISWMWSYRAQAKASTSATLSAAHELVLSGDGEVYVSGITASAPLSVYVTSGSQQELFLSYQGVAAGPSVAQTVTLSGADTVSLTEALKAGSTAVATHRRQRGKPSQHC